MAVLSYLVGAALVAGVFYVGRNVYKEYFAKEIVDDVAKNSPEYANENAKFVEETKRDLDEDKRLFNKHSNSPTEDPKDLNEDQTKKKSNNEMITESNEITKGTPRANQGNSISTNEVPGAVKEDQRGVTGDHKNTQETRGAINEKPLTAKESQTVDGTPKNIKETASTVKESPKVVQETQEAAKEKSITKESQEAVKGRPNIVQASKESLSGKPIVTEQTSGAVKENPTKTNKETNDEAKKTTTESPRLAQKTPGAVKDDEAIVNENLENIKKHQEIIEILKKQIDPGSNFLEKNLDSDFKKFTPFVEYRDVIVHLQDWKYKDIEAQCSNLGIIGFAAVQLSPVTAHVRAGYRENWRDRLHVRSYDFDNEYGTEIELVSLIKKCKENKVKVLVDVVINNMAPASVIEKGKEFKDIIYSSKSGRLLYKADDFHEMCSIADNEYLKESYDMDSYAVLHSGDSQNEWREDNSKCENFQKALEILKDIRDVYKKTNDKEGFLKTLKLREHLKRQILWKCWLGDFPDLKQVDEKGKPVRQILDLFRDLLYLGVSGFRVLTADFMNPDDLHLIYKWLPRQEIFIYHDFLLLLKKDALSSEVVLKADQYAEITRASDYKYARLLSRTFLLRDLSIKQMYQLQKELDILPSGDSVVFVYNVFTLSTGFTGFSNTDDLFIHPIYSSAVTTASEAAIAFMLISDHGIPLITSSFFMSFSGMKINRNEHLWSIFKKMIDFRYVMKKYNGGKIPPPTSFTEHGWSQASWCLGSTGFVIFNIPYYSATLKKTVDTCFDANGVYCDVYKGGLVKGKSECEDNSMIVTDNGKKGEIQMGIMDKFFAFHKDAYYVKVAKSTGSYTR